MLNHPDAKKFEVTAIVRSEDKAKVLQEKFGVKTVAGSIKDYAFVEKVVQDYHVIFQIVRELLYLFCAN